MKPSNKLETWGNETTMNLNNIVFQNVQASPYFKSLYELKTYHEVIDEIYNQVDNLEPFLRGTTASTAFCLLFKLWTLRLTVKQVNGVITHKDSPYIRALGFLYLRYVCKPAYLWEWFEPYLEDPEEIQTTRGPRPVNTTIGKLCLELLTEPKFLGTILPRIPVPIAREINEKLKDRVGDKYEDEKAPSRRSRSREEDRDRGSSRRDERRSYRSRSRSRDRYRYDRGYSRRDEYRSRDREGRSYSRSFSKDRRSRSRSYSRDRRSRSRSYSKDRRSRSRSPRRGSYKSEGRDRGTRD
ncbi:PRP38-domain-containing protein [Basidiobolus meristosporus CBS 931.73]|uniref:Pre-mRNA-splicing factor 38 n=1 Tax=Basidiobolus meristosporus CBS 931.73 TaxID=1314790 RepID=A0A1Y1XAH5_9FUNG|nr:PRP38-domain-containing protein [Basidiobolus meristosporus CBS 931.73]|eukprot:ORX82752.1 PRP38-domain-containing protein [Basidiobolus meristosporus CBS 931.73]